MTEINKYLPEHLIRPLTFVKTEFKCILPGVVQSFQFSCVFSFRVQIEINVYLMRNFTLIYVSLYNIYYLSHIDFLQKVPYFKRKSTSPRQLSF